MFLLLLIPNFLFLLTKWELYFSFISQFQFIFYIEILQFRKKKLFLFIFYFLLLFGLKCLFQQNILLPFIDFYKQQVNQVKKEKCFDSLSFFSETMSEQKKIILYSCQLVIYSFHEICTNTLGTFSSICLIKFEIRIYLFCLNMFSVLVYLKLYCNFLSKLFFCFNNFF